MAKASSNDEQKLRELILLIARSSERDEHFGATKLNKILFYSDFWAYRKLGRSITGEVYRKLEHGPAPKRLLPVVRRMEKDRLGGAGLLRPDPEGPGRASGAGPRALLRSGGRHRPGCHPQALGPQRHRRQRAVPRVPRLAARRGRGGDPLLDRPSRPPKATDACGGRVRKEAGRGDGWIGSAASSRATGSSAS